MIVTETATRHVATPGRTATPFDVERVRRDFPILSQQVNGKPLVYLDNAATAQKPQCVLDALNQYYTADNANVHRGVHALSIRATKAYELARVKVQRLLHAERAQEIIFCRGATEGINLVAQTYGRQNVKQGDEILVSNLEHHSNIVPWQLLCEQTGAEIRVIPINDEGELLIDEYAAMLGEKTRIVALAHVSNALGTINPVRRIADMAHEHGAVVVVDGAQAIPHLRANVRELDCDFYALSSHKAFGPTGVGALYGKFKLLDPLPPYQGGGEMIKSVSFEETIYADLPGRFEAGTPNIADAIAFGAAIDYILDIGYDAIADHEHQLLQYATAALSAIPQVRLIGTAKEKAAVVAFVIDGVHAHDIGTILDQDGIAVRTGHHCAQPVMERFGVPATVRASMAFYNTCDEIDRLATGIANVIKVFGL